MVVGVQTIKLALGSDDRTVSLSNSEGDSVDQTVVKLDPTSIQFSDGRGDSNRAQTLSVVLGGQALLLINVKDLDNPVELAFQPKYGQIRKYTWFSDSYLIVGFSTGYVIMVSNDMREISEELFNVKFHTNTLEALVCNTQLQKAATAGDACIKFINVGDWRESRQDRIQIQDGSAVTSMHWSKDGSMLTFALDSGHVACHLTKLTALAACHGTRMVYLTSLRELTIINAMNESVPKIVVPIEVEPVFCIF